MYARVRVHRKELKRDISQPLSAAAIRRALSCRETCYFDSKVILVMEQPSCRGRVEGDHCLSLVVSGLEGFSAI